MNWIDFFQSNGIHYIDSGPNTAKGNVNIHCVWCGAADESQHLSVNLAGKGFRCWRAGKQHSGKNPAKLIQALLNCSWEQAELLAGHSRTLPNNPLAKIRALMNKEEVKVTKRELFIPPEFKEFSKLPSCRMYLDYINQRGFIIEDTQKYRVYYASSGFYKGRVLFTVWQDGKLCGWTGRTVFPNEEVRYNTLTHDEEKAAQRNETPAPNPISHYLLFYDYIKNKTADTIVLCEGPFDAWKVNVLGQHIGVVATCFFTSTLSSQQLNLLHELLPRFKRRYLVLDENTFAKAARIKSDLITLDVPVRQLPSGIKDPALLKTSKQLQIMLAIV